MKLGTMLDIDKQKKVREQDYPKNFWIIQKSRKRVFADFAISDGFLWKSKDPRCQKRG